MLDLSKLIPHDNLVWSEEENKWICFTSEELDAIIEAAHESGFKELDDVVKVVRWCEKVRVGALLMERFMGGHIKVEEISDDNELYFTT